MLISSSWSLVAPLRLFILKRAQWRPRKDLNEVYQCYQASESAAYPPWHAKKRETRAQKTKIVGAGLEGFVDWTRVVDREPAEEEEMLSLAT